MHGELAARPAYGKGFVGQQWLSVQSPLRPSRVERNRLEQLDQPGRLPVSGVRIMYIMLNTGLTREEVPGKAELLTLRTLPRDPAPLSATFFPQPMRDHGTRWFPVAMGPRRQRI